MKVRHVYVALFCLMVCAALVLADTLKLKDGTVIEGTVVEMGDNYRVKSAAGEWKVIPKSSVATFTRGSSPSSVTPPPTAKPTTPGVTPGGKPPGNAPANAAGTSARFAQVKAKADRVDTPVSAVQLWENFIKKENPGHADLEAAKSELANWEKLKKDNAERIKGQWVGGTDRKRIVKQAKNLVRDGNKKIEEGQTEAGFKKFEEAVALYPQSFEGNFQLGIYYLRKATINVNARFDLASLDKAVKTLETASKIAPKSSSVWSNLAIGYSWKKKWRESIESAYKATQMHESTETVQNLLAALGNAPRGTLQQGWCKPIFDAAVAMAQSHNVQMDKAAWVYLPPAEGDEIPGASGPAGTKWSGSGFFITEDGFLLTNHHVATGDAKGPILPDITFRIRMDDGTEVPAELIAVDEAADIALMKIDTQSPVVPLKMADYLPAQGSELMTLGYPATGDDEFTLQISSGKVKSTHDGDEHEVWMDLNTTHGNSGGPIVDRYNHMVSIVTAYRQSHNMEIFLGVSTSQIKTFLAKVGDKAPKVVYAPLPKEGPAFDSENLTAQARSSTVWIAAIKSAE